MRIQSVNIGVVTASPHTTAASGGTAIHRRPVARIEVRAPLGDTGSGVGGDGIGDPRFHGGPRQAVYAFAGEELDFWSAALGRELPPGFFGENLTTAGLDVDGAVVGTRWRIGDALLEVTDPRVPCRTFAGHLGEEHWVRRFTEHERPGAYLAVVEPGVVEAGMPVEVGPAPAHGVTVVDVLRVLTGDLSGARRILEAGVLSDVRQEALAARLERSGRARTS